MKRVFKYKKGQFWDGDEDIIYLLLDILCGDDEKVKQDTKITIISEKLNTHPRCKENRK